MDNGKDLTMATCPWCKAIFPTDATPVVSLPKSLSFAWQSGYAQAKEEMETERAVKEANTPKALVEFMCGECGVRYGAIQGGDRQCPVCGHCVIWRKP